MKKLVYIIAACATLFTACEKGTLVETTEYEKVAPGDPKYSYVKILNLTPSSPVINYYMDGPKFTSALSSTGLETGGFAYNGLFPDLGYAVTSPGNHQLTAKIVPRALVDPGLQVLDKQITTAPGKYYTVITGGTYGLDKTIPSIMVSEDKKPALDTSKVFVRLVNSYNGGPSYDLVKDSATGTKLISNLAFGTASEFVEIPGTAGVGGSTASVKLFFNNSATGVPQIAAGTTLNFPKGRAYTIYTRGILGNTLFPFSATFYTTFY
jgi:hypothetical protein